MAIKKESGGNKKPMAKMAIKGQANRSMKKMAEKAKPKSNSETKIGKSRGSNTPKQIGDMNERENYNSVRARDTKSLKQTNAYVGKDGKTYSGTIKTTSGSNSKGSKTLRTGGRGR
jgi:hypothetical protein